ncbi:MAG: hypothetical protein P1U59_04405 [Alcanivorax sp.]|jgi:hypothetical protein|uniref:hypothetical protein n=1 Tax=Alcanivorax sp. TaxID=1872427 RepID=UPI00198B1E15|nr:hypothetical protein [Alcanivorax sp.]MBD3644428.1 hypothetical protein [Alcanivorax sp.]MDF1723736.1 hypothetical protein [Alcanivorax sp.]
MLYAEKITLIAGLCVVLYAYLRYWQRTRDTRGLLTFWRREMALTVSEFKWQRAGIALLLVAVALRFVQALL